MRGAGVAGNRSESRLHGYLVEALARTDGGGDELGEAAALHQDADVGQAAVEAAAVPHPHHCQHCCHDNQLHSQLGAAQRPAARGDKAARQTLQTVEEEEEESRIG